MTTSTEILNAAADLLEPDGAWCQREYARDADGYVTTPYSSNAVSWCAMGAIARTCQITDEASAEDFYRARDRLRETLAWEGSPDTADWNDATERTQAEVVAMLRRVAEEES